MHSRRSSRMRSSFALRGTHRSCGTTELVAGQAAADSMTGGVLQEIVNLDDLKNGRLFPMWQIISTEQFLAKGSHAQNANFRFHDREDQPIAIAVSRFEVGLAEITFQSRGLAGNGATTRVV